MTDAECVERAVRTKYLNVIYGTPNLQGFAPFCLALEQMLS